MGLLTGKGTGRLSDNGGGAIVPFGLLALSAFVVATLGGRADAALTYSRGAIEEGELWRLVTANLVHLGIGHLALNIAGLVLVGWLTGREYGIPGWSLIALAGAVSVTGGLYTLHAEVEWYVGLSGVLHGLLAAGLLPGLKRHEGESLLLAGLLLVKLVWEAVAGPLPGSEQSAGGPVLVEAHRYGALGGLAAGLLVAIWEARRRSV